MIKRFGLDFNLALFKGCQGLVAQLPIVPLFWSSVPSSTSVLGVIACSFGTNLNYGIKKLFYFSQSSG